MGFLATQNYRRFPLDAYPAAYKKIQKACHASPSVTVCAISDNFLLYVVLFSVFLYRE
jgi:hypothetical protein